MKLFKCYSTPISLPKKCLKFFEFFILKELINAFKYRLSFFVLFLFCSIAYAQDNFITTWQSDNDGTSGDTEITIPTNSSYTYNYSVDWDNDGIMDETGLTGDVTHDFGTAGEYTIQITGTFPSMYFNNGGDKKKITDISQWGGITWESMESSFYGCKNMTLTAIDAPDLSNCTNMFAAFGNTDSFNSNINHWDVSTITKFSAAFVYNNTFNQPLDQWDVSNGSDFGSMFLGATSFNQDISGWTTSSLGTIFHMFKGASSFDQNLGGWDVSGMYGCEEAFKNSALSTSNYDSTLIGWATQSVRTGRTLGVDGVNYCLGANARETLVNTIHMVGQLMMMGKIVLMMHLFL